MEAHGAWLSSAHPEEAEHGGGVEHRHIHAQHEQRTHPKLDRCWEIHMALLSAIQDAQQRITTKGDE